MDELAAGLAEVVSPTALFVTIVGGLAVGAVIESVMLPIRRWRGLALLIVGTGTLALTVFWSGQIVAEALDGDPRWGRAAARALLQEVFLLATAAGAVAMRARDDSDSSP